jgi:hypothetical protein
MRAFGEVSQAQRADGDASEQKNLVSDASQDSADLAVLPFGQRHLQFGGSFSDCPNARPLDSRHPFGEIDSFSETKELRWIQLALHDDEVGLGDTVLGMGQLLSQLPVVGQEQQPLAGTVQTADRKKSTAIRHQVDRANSSLWISIGAEHPCWFIEHQISGALLSEYFPVDADRAGDRIDSTMELDADLPIDLDAALFDQFFDLPS